MTDLAILQRAVEALVKAKPYVLSGMISEAAFHAPSLAAKKFNLDLEIEAVLAELRAEIARLQNENGPPSS